MLKMMLPENDNIFSIINKQHFKTVKYFPNLINRKRARRTIFELIIITTRSTTLISMQVFTR